MKFIFCFLLSVNLVAQDFNIEFVGSFGGQSYQVGNAVTVDENTRDVYVCGTFAEDITFNTPSGPLTYTSNGNADAYFAKLNEAGEILWAHQIGGENLDEANAIATDLNGNVYVLGRFLGNVDFDPGPGEEIVFGSSDFYLAKYDTDGNFQWMSNFNSVASEALALETDAAGNIFVTGTFQGTVSFMPVGGGSNMNVQSSLSGQAENVFIAKYNTNGELYFVKGLDTFSMNGIGSGPEAIDVDASGNVYVAGFFGFTVDFDPGPSDFIMEGLDNSADVFVLKLSSNGNFIWAKSMGGDNRDVAQDIAVDTNNNVFLGGEFRENLDFDPGPGSFELISNGNRDAFIVKLNDSGDFEWAKSFGSTSVDVVSSIDTDILGDVYGFGTFNNTVNFNTDPGETLEITTFGQTDMFLCKLNASGNFIYAKQMGGASFDSGSSVKIDSDFNAYVCGDFRETADIDPEETVSNIVSISQTDAFILKLDSTLPIQSEINIDFLDPNFKDALVNTNCVVTNIGGSVPTEDADTNDDGEINYGEAAAIQVLFVNGRDINSIREIEFFTNLDRLLANSNNLTEVDVSQNEVLQTLSLNYNAITNIDYFSYLKRLQLEENQFTSFEVIPNSLLRQLILRQNNLTSVALANAAELYELYISDNPLDELDLTQNTELYTFNSLNTLYTELDLSQNVELNTINLFNNPLIGLDLSSNINLEILYIANGALESLTVAGDLLDSVYCENNNLISLDLFNAPNLRLLNSENNALATLDISGNFEMESLELGSNQLETLFLKNGSTLSYLGINMNPNISYVCIDDFNPATGSAEFFQVQQALDNNGVTDYQISDYCSFLPGGTYYEISGETRFDIDNDGCDTDDGVYANLQFTISGVNGTGLSYANSEGAHFFPLQEGAYTITPSLENLAYFMVTPASRAVDFPADGTVVLQDFCVQADGVHPDLDIVIMPDFPAIPGFEATYTLIYHNKGNQMITDEIVIVYENLLMDFMSSSETPIAMDDNAVTFAFEELRPFETGQIDISFLINTPTDPDNPVNIDDGLIFTAQINPVAGDETPEDNVFDFEQIVVGSFDPNDIICLQGDEVPLNNVGEYVHYRIRFENTGTFPAQNVVVNTQINTDYFEVSTLIPLSASHDFITKINDENNVDFIFEDIQLPFEGENDGFIIYKIKTLATLTEGDIFTSIADIYFDFNEPITTNTASTLITELLGVTDYELSNIVVYPNPAEETLFIQYKNNVAPLSYSIRNVLGNVIIKRQPLSSSISVSQLAPGLYFLHLETDFGSKMIKFIKE
jgi:hypothetical protein